MKINLFINGIEHEFTISPVSTLFNLLRNAGYYSIKFGDEHGLSGVDTVLLDGVPINSSLMLAAQAEGHKIVTAEALGEMPEQGWKKSTGLHPLQVAFIKTGAIQCGYCTPAQLLASKALLDKNINPSEEEIREALSGVLCRCTGYQKPVEAVMLASSIMRNEIPIILSSNSLIKLDSKLSLQVVGKSEVKSDATKLAQGKPAFTADIDKKGMLYAKVLFSPMRMRE